MIKETRPVVKLWQDFLDSLNSDGGHILLLAFLSVLGMAGMVYGLPKSDDMYIGAFTALLILLKSAGSNKTRRDRVVPIDPPSDQVTINVTPKEGE